MGMGSLNQSVMEVRYIHKEAIHNYKAPSQVLPLVFEILKPKSILDIGCGIGTWLKVAKDHGVSDVLGIDGDYVDKSQLKIDTAEFVEKDLEKPFDLGRKFDLAICLEVAEHLKESSAANFVASLTKHADVILFSAALPGQGGQRHINEQWPDYWSNLFSKSGFSMTDPIRGRIWNNEAVDWWYRQNIFLVIRDGSALSGEFDVSSSALIHPVLFETVRIQMQDKIDRLENSLKILGKRDIVGKIKKLFRLIK
jgi:SAM-dependent methyltransferase